MKMNFLMKGAILSSIFFIPYCNATIRVEGGVADLDLSRIDGANTILADANSIVTVSTTASGGSYSLEDRNFVKVYSSQEEAEADISSEYIKLVLSQGSVLNINNAVTDSSITEGNPILIDYTNLTDDDGYYVTTDEDGALSLIRNAEPSSEPIIPVDGLPYEIVSPTLYKLKPFDCDCFIPLQSIGGRVQIPSSSLPRGAKVLEFADVVVNLSKESQPIAPMLGSALGDRDSLEYFSKDHKIIIYKRADRYSIEGYHITPADIKYSSDIMLNILAGYNPPLIRNTLSICPELSFAAGVGMDKISAYPVFEPGVSVKFKFKITDLITVTASVCFDVGIVPVEDKTFMGLCIAPGIEINLPNTQKISAEFGANIEFDQKALTNFGSDIRALYTFPIKDFYVSVGLKQINHARIKD